MRPSILQSGKVWGRISFTLRSPLRIWISYACSCVVDYVAPPHAPHSVSHWEVASESSQLHSSAGITSSQRMLPHPKLCSLLMQWLHPMTSRALVEKLVALAHSGQVFRISSDPEFPIRFISWEFWWKYLVIHLLSLQNLFGCCFWVYSMLNFLCEKVSESVSGT